MNSLINNKMKEIDLLFNRFDYIYHQIASKQGLSDTSFRILRAILILGEGCTQTNIYRSICLNKQTVNSAIKQLIKNDIIYFKGGKGRENKIYLTEKGKEIESKKIIPINNIEKDIIEELTIDEYEALLKIANKYINSLEIRINSLIDMEEE